MRKVYLIILAFVLNITIISASTNTIPRTDSDLGVNKKWNITEKNIDNVKRTPRVDASEKIYDFAEILTEAEEESLYAKIGNYIAETKMDVVVLTTDLEYSDYELEDYAADFYDYNDFGIDFNDYSGVIIIINMNSYNRFYNIYTFGNAMEFYSYSTCEDILDYIFYDVKNENYLEAFSKFVTKLKYYYDSGIQNGIIINENGTISHKFRVPWLTSIIVSAIITTIIMFILIKKNKMIKKETQAQVYLDRNNLRFNNMVDHFVSSHTTSYVINSNSGGGGSHSGSSGGSHGGGGGRHF